MKTPEKRKKLPNFAKLARRSPLDAPEAGLRILFQGAFPDADDFPAASPQGASYQLVALPVPSHLVFPEGAVAFGCAVTARTTVPETAVHEHREFDFWKNEIRFAEDFLIPSPAGDFVLPE